MRTTKQMSVTLPHEMADMIHAKVVSGEYASESEVIREGLRALAAHDRAVDAWLRNQVAPAYDRMMADPEGALSADEVRVCRSVPDCQCAGTGRAYTNIVKQ